MNLSDCRFSGCSFAQIRLHERALFINVTFLDCTIESVHIEGKDTDIWDPARKIQTLQRRGISFPDHGPATIVSSVPEEQDPRLQDIDKVLRYFLRSTHISESVLRIRLSNRGASFISEQIPELMKARILVEIENVGSVAQRRFKLGLPMTTIYEALASARGSYAEFLRYAEAVLPEQ